MNRVLGVFWFLVLSNQVHAHTNKLILKPQPNKTFQDTNEITDTKLRADSGSLSRYSMKFNFTYAGPPVTDFSAKAQPNPDGSVGTFQTALIGSIAARYRIDPKSTVGLSTGLKAIHPFQGEERTDVSNPALNYDFSSRVAEIQMKNSTGLIWRTVPEFTTIGQYGLIVNTQSMVYDLGVSRVSLGIDMSFGYFLYERGYEKTDGKAPRYSFELNPNLKYNFSEKLNVVTSVNVALWNPRSKEDQYALLNKVINQRLGLGYAYNRDTYFNPYISFYPDHMSWDRVTMNFTTIFSVF